MNDSESVPLKRKGSIPKLFSSASSKRKSNSDSASRTPETSPRRESDYEATSVKHHHSSKKHAIASSYASKKELLEMQLGSFKQIQEMQGQIIQLERENEDLNLRIDFLARQIQDVRTSINNQLQSYQPVVQQVEPPTDNCFTALFY